MRKAVGAIFQRWRPQLGLVAKYTLVCGLVLWYDFVFIQSARDAQNAQPVFVAGELLICFLWPALGKRMERLRRINPTFSGVWFFIGYMFALLGRYIHIDPHTAFGGFAALGLAAGTIWTVRDDDGKKPHRSWIALILTALQGGTAALAFGSLGDVQAVWWTSLMTALTTVFGYLVLHRRKRDVVVARRSATRFEPPRRASD